jgi:hypothetical protein
MPGQTDPPALTTLPPHKGVRSPDATAATRAAVVLTASAGVASGGRAEMTGRSFGGGTMCSRHSRIAVVSPANASSTAQRARASASPASSPKPAS